MNETKTKPHKHYIGCLGLLFHGPQTCQPKAAKTSPSFSSWKPSNLSAALAPWEALEENLCQASLGPQSMTVALVLLGMWLHGSNPHVGLCAAPPWEHRCLLLFGLL